MAENLQVLGIRALHERLRDGGLSPVQLARDAIYRLRKQGAALNAVATVTEDLGLRLARQAEREIKAGRVRGPLHGVPFGVKDLLATRGIPTTWGAQPYRNQVFDYDATVVSRLIEAGAVLVAKLSMVELAGGMGYNHADAAYNGPGVCPWNAKFWSGGSSSGPGSAVGAGLLPFAIGSETSGSILTPCAFSGVSGLRPTYGRVSRHGAMALAWSLDKLGPMARSADDCALVLAAIAGPDPHDPTSLEVGFTYPGTAPTRRWRLAVPKGCTEKVQPEVRANFEKSLEVLAGNAEIVREVEWPDFPWGPVVGTIVGAEGAAAFVDLIESGRLKELRCPRDRYAYARTQITAVDYLQAMRLRKPMKRAVGGLFRKFDAFVAPTRASVAYPIDKNFEEVYKGVSGGPPLIPAGNLCGHPAVCVPNGLGENGMPTSISFLGPALSETGLVAMGAYLQERTEWHRMVPGGA
jgi:aspartyl-tRNA(Asn)/glutamyl-tRNA(Gln) amidotransferase subunit A